MWCRAIDNYSKIAREVEPKKRRVADMSSKLDIKYKELAIK
jgi:dynein heavy chain